MESKKYETRPIPSIDLIPMLNVMMGILAFFVMITMSLANQIFFDVQLPRDSNRDPLQSPTKLGDLFIVEQRQQGQFLFRNQLFSQKQIEQQVQSYLQQNAAGIVFFRPNRQLPYEQVVQSLAQLREIGGDRVSLVID